MPTTNSSKNKLLYQILIVVFISILIYFTLNSGQEWGDDFSVYIAEGIALSEGRFQEQTLVNAYTMSKEEPVVYVWGYPLLLAIVHRIVGFDRVAYNSILYYKIPGAISLVLLGLVLFCFYKKRMSDLHSFFLSLIFSINVQIIRLSNNIITDMTFALVTNLCLLIIYNYRVQYLSNKNHIVLGVLTGMLCYLAFIIRNVVYALLIVLIITQIVDFFVLFHRVTKQARTAGTGLAGQSGGARG